MTDSTRRVSIFFLLRVIVTNCLELIVGARASIISAKLSQ
jgi:hypothetical protein